MLVVPQKKLGRIDVSNSRTLEVRKTSPNVIVSVMVPLTDHLNSPSDGKDGDGDTAFVC